MNMPKEVEIALKHVQSVHPEVCLVVFDPIGRWIYMDENFDRPAFDGRIDVSLLEDAANAVEFPAVYYDPEYYS